MCWTCWVNKDTNTHTHTHTHTIHTHTADTHTHYTHTHTHYTYTHTTHTHTTHIQYTLHTHTHTYTHTLHTHTIRIHVCTVYCFSTATMLTQKRLDIAFIRTLLVHLIHQSLSWDIGTLSFLQLFTAALNEYLYKQRSKTPLKFRRLFAGLSARRP
jgi:hypothetical protein